MSEKSRQGAQEEFGQHQVQRGLLISLMRSLLPVALFLLSLWIIHRLFREFQFSEIRAAVTGMSWNQIILALVLCTANYLVLGLYDIIACASFDSTLPRRRILLASLTSYSVGQTLGMPLFTGAAIRYRFYTRWGMRPADVLRIVLFASTSFWLGLLSLLSLVVLFQPHTIGTAVAMPLWALRTGALIFLSAIVSYATMPRGRVRYWFGRRFSRQLPEPRYRIKGMLVAVMDWLLAAATMYVLFPPESTFSFLHTTVAFLTAQVVGVVSNVPGGLGVFEASVLFLLGQEHPAPSVLGALVVYRFVYYFLPFMAGFAVLMGFELRRLLGWQLKFPAFAVLSRVLAPFVPALLAMAVFVAGLILLLSGSSPTAEDRLWWVTDVVPLIFVEGGHFLNSIVGTLLLVMALSVRKRLNTAWTLTMIMLVLGAVASILKGFDFEEATYLLVVALLLNRSRTVFTRRGKFITRFTPREASIMFMALGAVVWLGFFSYRDISYSDDLWWEFAASSDAPRFLRASVVSALLFVCLYLSRLLRAQPFSGRFPDDAEIAELHRIVQSCRETEANLALVGDKYILMGEDRKSFIMYRISGRSWISMGDPVAETDEQRQDLFWKFRELSDAHSGLCVFYEVGLQNLPLYIDAGLDLFKLGEHALVPLKDFTLEGSSMKSTRQAVRRVEREGGEFSVIPRAETGPLMADLKRVSDIWLGGKATREKGFSLGYFDPRYLSYFDIAVVRKHGEIIAFANLWQSAHNEELSVDLMRFTPDMNGIMDYLFAKLMLWGQERGVQRFNLGMAPLSGLGVERLAPAWSKVGGYLFGHGEHFYNFQGLRDYKEKFKPEWEPRYIASPGGRRLPVVLANVGMLVSGGLRGLITK